MKPSLRVYIDKTFHIDDIENELYFLEDYLNNCNTTYPENIEDYDELFEYVENKEDYADYCLNKLKDEFFEYCLDDIQFNFYK